MKRAALLLLISLSGCLISPGAEPLRVVSVPITNDTYLDQDSPTTKRGSETTLRWSAGSGSHEEVLVLTWVVPDVNLQPGEEIDSANVVLRIISAVDEGGATCRVYRESWTLAGGETSKVMDEASADWYACTADADWYMAGAWGGSIGGYPYRDYWPSPMWHSWSVTPTDSCLIARGELFTGIVSAASPGDTLGVVIHDDGYPGSESEDYFEAASSEHGSLPGPHLRIYISGGHHRPERRRAFMF